MQEQGGGDLPILWPGREVLGNEVHCGLPLDVSILYICICKYNIFGQNEFICALEMFEADVCMEVGAADPLTVTNLMESMSQNLPLESGAKSAALPPSTGLPALPAPPLPTGRDKPDAKPKRKPTKKEKPAVS